MKLKKEIPLIAIVLLPIIYLAYLWNDLPSKVPVRWNIEGEIAEYADKSELIVLPVSLPLLMYLTLLIIPKIDPKNKLNKMGSKLQSVKFVLTTFMSVFALFVIHTTNNQSLTDPNYIVLLIGVLFIFLGNYFKTIQPNYFIGIRTPWTLENEEVWKRTHKLGGVLFFVSGVLLLLSSLIFENKSNFLLLIVLVALISVTSITYSYLEFKNVKKTA